MKHLYLLLICLITSGLIFTSCNDDSPEVVTPPYEITLSHSEKLIEVGDKFTLLATITPLPTKNMPIIWASGNTSIATVNSNGEVSAVAEGVVIITATFADGSKKASCTVSVFEYKTIITYQTKNLAIGEEFKLDASITPPLTNNDAPVWSSSNANVATISTDGMVMAKSVGEAVITADFANGFKIVSCTITVHKPSAYNYQLRLVLKDKGTGSYSVSKPEEFLSEKSINRRKKQNIAINETDLPISADYIKAIEDLGGVITAKSKWVKTITVYCTDEFMVDEYKNLPFVESVSLVWRMNKGVRSMGKSNKFSSIYGTAASTTKNATHYGHMWDNIRMNNGQILHQKGLKGKGIDIAVIDAGFDNFDKIFAYADVKGAKSFIFGDDNVYNNTHFHGLEVVSCMLANEPGKAVGTAPEASYWLLRTEDVASEFPVEEDYWVSAIEYADSVGVDVVTSSLGYQNFNQPVASHTNAETNGKTILMSISADMAADKGILVTCSAGNTGGWVSTPGDAHNILTVGSVDRNSVIASNSSKGITADGRIKPNIVALGVSAACINTAGKLDYQSGTSYSTPIICGQIACLWQAYPGLTAKQVVQIVNQSGNMHNKPTLPFGNGAPDMQKAMELAEALLK